MSEAAEQIRLIRDSASAITGADLRRIRALRFTRPGFDPAVWRQMAELGWTGLVVPDANGGAGLGAAELCALAEELGAALVPEPLIPCAVSALLLASVESEAATLRGAGAAGEVLAAMLAGEAVVLTAWQEAAGALDAPGTPDAPRSFVPMAAGATHFLVPLRDGARVTLALQEAGACETETTQDGGNFGTLLAQGGVRIEADGAAMLARALDLGALGTAATLLGVMERAFAMTLDYLRTREQFGRKIGGFQVLQHRAADLRMQIALTRASVEQAARVFDAGAPAAPRAAAVSRAKARASDAAMLVTRQAIQLHGGIGYTDEHDIGLYLRKAMVLAPLFGGAAAHRRRFQALAPDGEE
jgi:alkylation response protein AidB-like acyl-CoA dehydrogenase